MVSLEKGKPLTISLHDTVNFQLFFTLPLFSTILPFTSAVRPSTSKDAVSPLRVLLSLPRPGRDPANPQTGHIMKKGDLGDYSPSSPVNPTRAIGLPLTAKTKTNSCLPPRRAKLSRSNKEIIETGFHPSPVRGTPVLPSDSQTRAPPKLPRSPDRPL